MSTLALAEAITFAKTSSKHLNHGGYNNGKT